jgi:YD repeat-containing protein
MTAAEPAATPNGSAVTVTYTYDPTGNLATRTGPTGECRKVDYVADFKDQPIAEHIFLGAGCAGAELKTSMQYDRGLNALLRTQIPSTAEQAVTYDAFGRPSSTSRTSVTGILSLETNITYSDPLASMHWAKVTRPASDPANQSTTWSYSDNFGDPVITFTQADSAAGDGADWIAHPEPVRSARGQPVGWYRPWFYAGDPANYAIGTPDGALAFGAAYDFMSRRTQMYRASDAHFTERRSYHALSVDIWDGENIQGAPSHVDMYSTVEMDGAGRTKRTTKRTETGTVVTRTDHLATGELVALEQTD